MICNVVQMFFAVLWYFKVGMHSIASISVFSQYLSFIVIIVVGIGQDCIFSEGINIIPGGVRPSNLTINIQV